MTLSEKIYALRKRLGLSQEELADALGVSRQSVSNWETGAAKPEIGKLSQLAKVLGVTVDFLLDEGAEVAGPGGGDTPNGEAAEGSASGASGASGSSEDRSEGAAPSSSDEDPARYPEWLDRLPRFLQRSAHRYGWIFGIRYAVLGLIFVVFGFIGRAMVRGFFSETATMGFGSGGIVTSGDLPPDVVRQIEGQIGGAPAAPGSGFMSIIPNAAIVIGAIFIIGGLALAYALKQWGKRQQAEDEA